MKYRPPTEHERKTGLPVGTKFRHAGYNNKWRDRLLSDEGRPALTANEYLVPVKDDPATIPEYEEI